MRTAMKHPSEIPLAPVKLNGSAGWLRPIREQPGSHKKEIGSLFAKETYLLNFTYIYDKKRFL